ncbi:diguanylate cyclase (GGDEF) domain-containing protein [Actinopolyspora xinjiangensis]|uniref:Diguanylate cyclase (GGDEF) domain-containing protein n=2 Tax=Actinopolyspora xinjiangensis TaxID=405564 RepID=A0A1H0X2K8_9ACTN|nr:diguanylate cyclase (GGDEF) domain-containing protein [Actinopolyspora xinjiangensis]
MHLCEWMSTSTPLTHRSSRSTATLGTATVAAAAGWAATAYRLRMRTRQLARAHRDPVTGLLTRTGFEAAAARTLTKANAVGLLDLDGFKPINDTHGHHTGDRVLRTVARRLDAELGTAAVTGRLGGDELAFVAHLSELDQLDRLLSALTTPITLPDLGRPLHVGVSLGITTVTTPAPDLNEALEGADLAMYEAKTHRVGWRVHSPQTVAEFKKAVLCPPPCEGEPVGLMPTDTAGR